MSIAAFVVILLGTMLGGLAQTQMNTVLPQCMEALGIVVGQAQVLVNAYLLVLGIVIPVYAFLARRYSTRALFIAALLLFALGSILISVTSDFAVMLAGRVLQGCAAGIMFPLSQTVALTEFPPEKRATMMGFLGLAMGFAPNIGPTLAGACAVSMGWRSSFFLLIALSVVFLVLAVMVLPKQRVDASDVHRLDVPSVVFSTLGFGGVLMGLSNVATYGIADVRCIVPCVIGAICLVLFVRREQTADEPMLHLDVFKDRDFTVGTVMICALFAAFIGVTLLIPLYVQGVLGDTALQSGMILFPGVIAALIVNPLSGWLMGRIGPRPIVCISAVLLVVGTVGLMHLGNMTDLYAMAAWQGVRAFGISGLIMPISTWSFEKLGPRTADGTSISNAIRQIASAVGTSIIVLLAAEGVPGGAVTSSGTDVAMTFSLVMSLIVLAMSFAFVDRK